jgi:hypothetical protein
MREPRNDRPDTHHAVVAQLDAYEMWVHESASGTRAGQG